MSAVSEAKISHAAAIVPVFNPEDGLTELCRQLTERFELTVVVDDGSTARREDFDRLPGSVTKLVHPQNLGKGRAIKTALGWIGDQHPEIAMAIVADGDGQHRVDDIAAVARRCLATDSVTMGVRDFSGVETPFRSKFGNVCTSWLVRTFMGFRVYDTQTGLRAIPRRLFGEMIALPGERYEYEMRLFGLLKRLGEKLEQVNIVTVYLNENRASHFSPVRDSIRIYRGLFGDFLRLDDALARVRRVSLFAISALASFAVDTIGFCLLFDRIFGADARGRLLWSVVIARAVSLVFNFTVNRYVVFRESRAPLARAFVRYLALAAVIMICSYGLTAAILAALEARRAVAVKVMVDLTLFMVSYVVQHRKVFSAA